MAIEITGRINFDDSSVQEATKSVQGLKDEINEVNETDFSSAEESFSAFKDSADVLAGSVSTLVGGLAVLGVENEYIENLEQAAVGAIAFGQGVDQAGQAILNLQKNTKVASAAQRVFNVVANANPYLLAITALVGATAAFVALADALSETALEQALANKSAEELGQTLIDNADAAEELGLTLEDQVEVFGQAKDDALERLKATEETENSLRLQGKTEEEIADIKQQNLQDAIDFAISQRKAQKAELDADIKRQERYQNITKAILQFLTAPLQLILGTVDTIVAGLEAVGVISEETAERFGGLREGFNETVSGFLFDPEETKKEGEAVLEESKREIDRLQNQRDGFILRRQQKEEAERQKRQEKEQAERERRAEERRKENEKAAQEEAERQKEIEEREQEINDFLAEKQKERTDALLTEQKRQENSVIESFDAQIKAAGDNAELVKKLEREKEAQLDAIKQEFAEKQRLREQEVEQALFQEDATQQELEIQRIENYYAELAKKAEGNAELLAEIEKRKNNAVKETNEKFRQQELEQTAQLQQQRVQQIQAASDAVIATFGAETKAGRAALIAKQIIAAQELIQEAKSTITFSKLKAAESQAAVAAGTAKTAAVGFPQNIPLLITYALQAVGIISAVRKAVQGANQVAANVSGAGGGGGGPELNISQGNIVSNAGPNVQLFGQGGATEEGGEIESTDAPQTETPTPVIRAVVSQVDLEDSNDTLDTITNNAQL